MGQEHICGVAIEPECPNLTVEEVKALKFQVELLDYLADLFDSLTKPEVAVSLFEPKENATLSATLIPASINGIAIQSEGNAAPTVFVLRIALATNNQVQQKAFAELLLLSRLAVNFVEKAQRKWGLTFATNLGITNSNEAVLALTINKRL